jgi:hypothetical protein
LVPWQATTGGRPKLLGITKRGSKYLRKMLIQGAPASMPILRRSDTRLGAWLRSLLARSHPDTAVVALAAKMARLGSDEENLLEEVAADGRMARAGLNTIAARLRGLRGAHQSARILLCGHIYPPDLVRLDDDTLVLNSGSGGCPTFDAGTFVPQAGTPHVRYTLLERGVRELVGALSDSSEAAAALKAREAVRALVDRSALTPEPVPGRKLSEVRIDLEGALAGILQLAAGAKAAAAAVEFAAAAAERLHREQEPTVMAAPSRNDRKPASGEAGYSVRRKTQGTMVAGAGFGHWLQLGRAYGL